MAVEQVVGGWEIPNLSAQLGSFFSLGPWPVAIENWAFCRLSSGIDYYTSPEAVTHYGRLPPLEGGRSSNIGVKWVETDEVCR